jgi:hypothetical protein
VNVRRTDFEYPTDPCGECGSPSRSLWGHPARMLTAGGGWDPNEPVAVRYSIAVSRLGSLVKNMVIEALWCRHQIHQALSKPDNLGGEYYQSIASDPSRQEGLLDSWIAGSRALSSRAPSSSVPQISQPPNDHLPPTVIRGLVRPGVWRVVRQAGKDFEVMERSARTLVTFIEEKPRTKTEATERGPVKKRVAGTYLAQLIDSGLVTQSREKHLCRDGRQREACVLRVADEVTVARMLHAELPDPDRRMWEWLRDWRRAPGLKPLTAEEALALLDGTSARPAGIDAVEDETHGEVISDGPTVRGVLFR